MKKVNFKNVLMTLMVAFTFLFVGVGTGNAQTGLAQGLYSPASGTFVSSDQAGVVLAGTIQDMGDLLQTISPGSSVYTSTARQAIYYKGIMMEINAGHSVAESIGTGLTYLNDAAGYGEVPRNTLASMKQEAITVLSN